MSTSIPPFDLPPQPQRPSTNWSQLLLFILAAGGGGTIVKGALELVGGNLTNALLFIILGVLLGGVSWFFGIPLRNVAKKQQIHIEKAINEAIDKEIRRNSTAFQDQYQRFVLFQASAIETAILMNFDRNIPLEEVFVELSIDEDNVRNEAVSTHSSTEPQIASRQYGTSLVPRGKGRDRFTIWHFLDSAHQPENQTLVILGYPGSGKTTLLKHITLVLLDAAQRKKYGVSELIPVRIVLREEAKRIIENPQKALIDLLVEILQDKMGILPDRDWLEFHRGQGKLLFMFDGLDEIPDKAQRKAVVDWLDRQITSSFQCYFILSSRPKGYEGNPLQAMRRRLVLEPLSPTQQRALIDNWNRMQIKSEPAADKLNEKELNRFAMKRSDELVVQIKGSEPEEMAGSPLLLTMILIMFNRNQRLPDTRIHLYKSVCEVSFTRMLDKGIKIGMDTDQGLRVLGSLAFHMLQQNILVIGNISASTITDEELHKLGNLKTPLDSTTFLEQIILHSGLLREKTAHDLEFAHKTLQEFLAAHFMNVTQPNPYETLMIEQIRITDKIDWWQPVIIMYCALGRAGDIIDACLNIRTIDSLSLAIACHEVARTDYPETVKQKYRKTLLEGAESDDVELRKIVSQAMLKNELRTMRRIGEDTFISGYLTNGAYQGFVIDAQQQDSENYAPSQWESGRIPKGQATEVVVGITPERVQKFCFWLIENIGTGEQWFRLPHASEIGQISSRAKGCWIEDGVQISWQSTTSANLLGNSEAFTAQSYFRHRDFTILIAIAKRICTLLLFFVTSDRAHVSTRARLSARARVSILNNAIGLDFDRALDRALDRASALVSASELALDFDRASALANELALILALALGRANKLASTTELDFNLVRALDRASKLAFDLMDLIVPSNPTLTSAPELASTLANELASVSTLELASVSALELASVFGDKRDFNKVRQLVAQSSLAVLIESQQDIDPFEMVWGYSMTRVTEHWSNANSDEKIEVLQAWQEGFTNLIEAKKREIVLLHNQQEVHDTIKVKQDEIARYQQFQAEFAEWERRLRDNVEPYEGLIIVREPLASRFPSA